MFGGQFATAPTFGQPPATNSMFPSIQPTNIFQSPSSTSFNTSSTAQPGFGSNLFGQAQPSTSNLFAGGNTFGQNKATYGFGATTANQTGLFGQQPAAPTSNLFQSNTPNLFGATANNAFGSNQSQAAAGTVVKFSPVTGTDNMQKNGLATTISTKHHCITCMKEYENKSLEELRFEDYCCNRKGPQAPGASFTSGFGGTTGQASTTLFGPTDNKPAAFNQTPGFGQTSTFGQGAPSFGSTVPSSTTNLFGKTTTGFGTPTTNAAPSFGFNATTPAVNPFSANQAAKPFSSQPLFSATPNISQPQTQNTFGTGVFGQTAPQNAGSNLFQKPASTTSFITGQPGFSFNQPASTTQTSNLFTPKSTTGFGIFGQTNPGTTAFGQSTQPSFGTSFGKPTTTFGQTAQPAFGATSGGGIQQQPLFGNTAPKPGGLFGNTTGGSTLFNSSFQQAPNSFSLNLGQQQAVAAFPPEPIENISLVATDIFPDGPHIYGLEPIMSDSHNTTNPQDIKALLENSKRNDGVLIANSKIRVHLPKPKRATNYNKEFFEANQALRGSRKCLVLRKFNSNTNSLYNKYKNELLDEAQEHFQPSSEQESSTNLSLDDSSIFMPPIASTKQHCGSTPEDTDVADLSETDEGVSTLPSELEFLDNPAGVTLTRPEYFMKPPIKDLHKYMTDSGECIVRGLNIGRWGYGNVFFPDPIDIKGMNLDEIIYFRHREIIVYPNDAKKPPVGEGLNRPAQVTLDKIFPREKTSNNYITDVDQIVQSNFVDNLIHVTQKHNCVFVDYRPETGSWVFKVKHFSKYGFTESDEEECVVANEKKLTNGTGPKKTESTTSTVSSFKSIELEGGRKYGGLGGRLLFDDDSSTISNTTISNTISNKISEDKLSSKISSTTSVLEVEEEEPEPEPEIEEEEVDLMEDEDEDEDFGHPFKHQLFNKESLLSMEVIETESFEKLPLILPVKETIPITIPEGIFDSTGPQVYKMPYKYKGDVTTGQFKQRCYSDLALFQSLSFKAGWCLEGVFNFSPSYVDNEISYEIRQYDIDCTDDFSYDNMIPNISDLLEIALGESELSLSDDKIPTFTITGGVTYLHKIADKFDEFTKILPPNEKYLCSVWKLCTALWGRGDNSPHMRKQYLSDWVKAITCNLNDTEWNRRLKGREIPFIILFKLLSFNKVSEACEYASKNKLNRLSLLIGLLGGNERTKNWLRKYLETYAWKDKKALPDSFRRLFLLLSGLPVDENINIFQNLDWLRCLGLYLWYIAPAACPISFVVDMYKKSFKELKYSAPPKPRYSQSEDDTSEYDLLYHILNIYVDSTYQLRHALHPATHTTNFTDYRLSWFLLQLFSSLKVGLKRDSEEQHIHIAFSQQLESMGNWKWAIFVLLNLKNNVVKENLIKQILTRRISTFDETEEEEKDLVEIFKIPPTWIHEVKALRCGEEQCHLEQYQHYVLTEDWQHASDIYAEHILPRLFINEEYDQLMKCANTIFPFSRSLLRWNNEIGLYKDYFELRKILNNTNDQEVSTHKVGEKLRSILARIESFKIKNNEQKLCIAELSRKSALLFKILYKTLDIEDFHNDFIRMIEDLIMPPDYKQIEIHYLIGKYVHEPNRDLELMY